MTDTLPAAPPRTFGHVAVLMGGLSAERSVSLRSGEAVLWKGVREVLPGAQPSVVVVGARLRGRERDVGRRLLVAYLQGLGTNLKAGT